ncbi:hypothetical protein TVAG_104450 [Trichomonas vaginalis G3]|uniref:RING-type domain-containing protein n=1 Tax=Trichomonas vaginalis (strain ATCC PRA-98 / G3) TaxID=412133 RepID=A2F693_TRIV3|nr:NEDD8 transferase protein [Trichomonas vaginalis G3]EAX99564.1 hypothetical protein TVAG_104450 [Trichomonas vaginalis G3]KAI5490949.1 NEDD8 transferase protein [Trichomonas vaginalis G3]|eukprot:XP_001312494.1 hypothetical protein [Trichomonas vaginalis G3]
MSAPAIKKVSRAAAKSTATTEQVKSTENEEIELKITKISAVYQEINSRVTDNCGICKTPLGEPCNNCAIQGTTECPVEEGICGHAFHKHCLTQWLNTSRLCPTCGRNWESR